MTTSLARRVVGVDPGKRGALAFFEPATGILDVWDVPTYTKTNSAGRTFVKVDIDALRALARVLGPIDLAIHEKVGARPGEAPSYAFDFGFTTGLLIGALLDAEHTRQIAPAIWKGRFGLSSDKNESRALATKMFPAHAHLFKRVKDDGRAEAALLAHYGAYNVRL